MEDYLFLLLLSNVFILCVLAIILNFSKPIIQSSNNGGTLDENNTCSMYIWLDHSLDFVGDTWIWSGHCAMTDCYLQPAKV